MDDARALRGILLLVAAMILIPWMDGIAKYLSATLPVLQIAWARFAANAVLLVPIALARHGRAALVPPRLGGQTLRALLIVAATVLFFESIARIPMADALAVYFLAPLIVTATSPLLLGEQVGARRWTAVLVGFAGAVVVVRANVAPTGGDGGIDPGARWTGTLFAVAASFAYAGFVLATRRLAAQAPPLVTLAAQSVIGALACTALVLPVWTAPSALEWALFGAIGAVSGLSHFLLISAHVEAEASLLAPFAYSEIVMSVIVGLMLFGDFPSPLAWTGIAIIVGSGVYVALRTRRRGQLGGPLA